MDYYVDTRQRDFDQLRISGSKGHEDFFNVLDSMGLHCIRIPTLRHSDRITALGRIKLEMKLRKAWQDALKDIGAGDRLILHSPPSEKFIGLTSLMRKVRERGCRICVVVFDTEQFYMPQYKRAAALKHMMDRRLENSLFRIADVVVAHTEVMRDMLAGRGIDRTKIICAEAWDHLMDSDFHPESQDRRIRQDLPVVFCGNLEKSKSGFLYAPDTDVRIDLYGPGYTGSENCMVAYKGVFRSEELAEIIEGSYGLVWDGPSCESCIGTYGEYLLYNIPHKVSFYLACGLPVIIWDKAAMADMILSEGCGLTVGNLSEIKEKTAAVDPDEYQKMREAAMRAGRAMRTGKYIRSFTEKALEMMK